jgi:hypothetical protein
MRKAALTGAFLALVFVSGCGSSESPGAKARASIVPGRPLPKRLPASTGRTFFVSTTGSNSNPGTRRRPWRTVQHALDVLNPGQRVLVRGGTYSENLLMERDGTAGAPITIANYPGERPVLRAAGGHTNDYPLELYSTSYLRVHGFVIEGASGPSSADVYFEADTHHVELSGNEIRDSADQGVFSERTTHHLQILGNAIHDNGPSPAHQSHGIYLEGDDQLVANNLVYDNRYGFGVHIYPSAGRVWIVDNTIVGNGRSGIVLGAAGSTTVNKATIVNNIVAFNAKAGIQSHFPAGTILGKGNKAYLNVGFGNPNGDFVEWTGGGIDYSRGNIVGDPRFRDRAAHDYRLTAGSHALDRAVPGYSLRRDFAGRRRPQGRRYDIGALERPR